MLAARSGRDFTAASPRRRPAKRRDWRGAALAFLGRHWRPLGAGAAILAAGGVIAGNALFSQTSRHPAPLFAAPKPTAVAAVEAKKPEAAPLPPSRPGVTGSLAPAAPGKPGRDAIGDLIRTEGAPAARPQAVAARPAEPQAKLDAKPEAKPEAKPAPEPQRAVLAGQKALVKLGYGPLKTDGLMGPGTRQAIERFERDRSLPVTGELAGRTLKALAVQAAMPIE